MIRNYVIFICFLGILYPSYCSAQSDSVFAVNVKDIRNIEDSTVRVLALNFPGIMITQICLKGLINL